MASSLSLPFLQSTLLQALASRLAPIRPPQPPPFQGGGLIPPQPPLAGVRPQMPPFVGNPMPPQQPPPFMGSLAPAQPYSPPYGPQGIAPGGLTNWAMGGPGEPQLGGPRMRPDIKGIPGRMPRPAGPLRGHPRYSR